MITTKHALPVLVLVFILIVAITAGMFISSAHGETTAEPTEAEKNARWEIMDQNIKRRVKELLATEEIFKDGIGISNWDQFECAYSRIYNEEAQAFWEELYGSFSTQSFDEIDRAYDIEMTYQDSGEASIMAPNFSALVYTEHWRNYVARLREYEQTDETALYYEIEPFYALRFSDGETVFDYLRRQNNLAGDFSDETFADEFNGILIGFLEKCSVANNGYLVYQEPSGANRIVLAWYSGNFKIYSEYDFDEKDLRSLPRFYN